MLAIETKSGVSHSHIAITLISCIHVFYSVKMLKFLSKSMLARSDPSVVICIRQGRLMSARRSHNQHNVMVWQHLHGICQNGCGSGSTSSCCSGDYYSMFGYFHLSRRVAPYSLRHFSLSNVLFSTIGNLLKSVSFLGMNRFK